MPGLYLPKTARELQQHRDSQNVTLENLGDVPHFAEAMQLQKRLNERDVSGRLLVTWAVTGPHARRWVVQREDDAGQTHVVKVFQYDDGAYMRPDPTLADRLMLITGRRGDELLKQIEAEDALREKHNQDYEDEFYGEFGERMVSAIKRGNGVKDSILVK